MVMLSKLAKVGTFIVLPKRAKTGNTPKPLAVVVEKTRGAVVTILLWLPDVGSFDGPSLFDMRDGARAAPEDHPELEKAKLEYAKHAPPEPIEFPAFEKIIPLSTGHLPEDIAKHHMEAIASMVGDHGWLVLCRDESFAYREEALRTKLAASGAATVDIHFVVNIMRAAFNAGADYVNVDADALDVDGLPFFEW